LIKNSKDIYIYMHTHRTLFFKCYYISVLLVVLQSKLDDYQARNSKGERLNQDQLVSKESKHVLLSLSCFSDFLKSFSTLGSPV